MGVYLTAVGGAALLFLAVFTAICFGVGWASPGRRGAAVRALLSTVVPCVLLLVAGVWAFELAAIALRSYPSGGQLQGADWDAFRLLARAAFLSLYAVVLATAGAAGSLLGRRFGKGRAVGIGSAVAVLAFMAITLPLAEFANACYVGEAFVLSSSC